MAELLSSQLDLRGLSIPFSNRPISGHMELRTLCLALYRLSPFDDYCWLFGPDFLLCSRAFNRPTGPGKSFFDTSFKLITLTANKTMLCFISVGEYLEVQCSNPLLATFFLLAIVSLASAKPSKSAKSFSQTLKSSIGYCPS